MNNNLQAGPPPFTSNLSSLIWPMSEEVFLSSAKETEVLFQPGDSNRLNEIFAEIGSYDPKHLFALGEETTIWKQGGLRVSRGTDSEKDFDDLVAGTTIQTHLNSKLAYGRRFISNIAQQMSMADGFFSIFASKDTKTTTHYDRNYNFTIQLFGEKTWYVNTDAPAVDSPSGNAAFEADRLAKTAPHMHGIIWREPNDKPTAFDLTPGDMLYVPPGFWHATKCSGLSVQLNISIEPNAWFQVVGDALFRHLEAQPDWRAPFGTSSEQEKVLYISKLKKIVNELTIDDISGDPPNHLVIDPNQPLRRTLGSLLMWESSGAGIHYDDDELRFLAKGTRGRWIDILKIDMEPALAALAHLEEPKSVLDLSMELQLDSNRLNEFIQQLFNYGYLSEVP